MPCIRMARLADSEVIKGPPDARPSREARGLLSGAVRRVRRAPVNTAALAGSEAVRGEEYLTVAEVAARFKLTPKTVRNKMRDGTWRCGEHWFSPRGIGPRFRRSALVAWLEDADAPTTT